MRKRLGVDIGVPNICYRFDDMTEVVLFHHAFGLTPGVVDFADKLRGAGPPSMRPTFTTAGCSRLSRRVWATLSRSVLAR
jgi:hypothetical protein